MSHFFLRFEAILEEPENIEESARLAGGRVIHAELPLKEIIPTRRTWGACAGLITTNDAFRAFFRGVIV